MRVHTTLVLLLGLLLLGAVAADEAKSVTVEGKIACAKCTLGVEGAEDCQNVLVVEQKEGDPAYYYLVDNAVTEEFGHECRGHKAAVVTGTLEHKDGKTWLTASEMKAPEKA